jgi:hypothetical protein
MRLSVVHLARRHNGIAPFQAFLGSYVARNAGLEHELVLALKGYESDGEARPLLDDAAARGVEARHILLPDDGLDLTAYARVAEEVRSDRFCFLNSYSRILADDWLALLNAGLDEPDVALAGAGGTWLSMVDYTRFQLGLRNGYDGVLPGRELTRLRMLEHTRATVEPNHPDRGPVVSRAGAAVHLLRQARRFRGFPNPFIRTNAFVIERDLLRQLSAGQVRTKLDAYNFESGRRGLTATVLAGGSRAVVVGRDGRRYDVDDWPDSQTVWQEEQQNLLVADNRTDEYLAASAERRRVLSQLAWGRRARPS